MGQPLRLAGNTIATPELNVLEALAFFREIGLDGVDFLCDDSSGVGVEMDGSARREVRAAIDESGLEAGCLRQYMRDLHQQDATLRQAHIDGLKRHIDLAVDLGYGSVRLFAGRSVPDDDWEPSWRRLVDGIIEAGIHAASAGVVISIENHHGTMTDSAARTMRAVREAGLSSVGVGYDQANLTGLHQEPWTVALPLQAEHIVAVDVKDIDFAGPNGAKRCRPLGAGIVPWPEIIPALLTTGYSGMLSIEYERKWHPEDLPEARIGVPREIAYLRGLPL
jgi:sugar phosphate isomerase/epimerase